MRFNSNRRGFHPDLGTTMDDSQRHGSFLDMSDGRVSCFIYGVGVRGEWIQGVSGVTALSILTNWLKLLEVPPYLLSALS
ncbi:hypothetical protein BKM14_25420 [Pseudomonas syringae pv. syringae]|nr:hypothetical protein BKM14_25420 [Pseudomonas syringae pv. syringae]